MTLQVIRKDYTAYEFRDFSFSFYMYESDGETPLWTGAATGSAAGAVLTAPAGTELQALTVANGRIVMGNDGLVSVYVWSTDYAGSFLTGGTTQHWHYYLNYIPSGGNPQPCRAGTLSVVPQ